MAMGPERSRLHNFNLLPFLKWGNSRLLRCMKENPNGEIPLAAAAASGDRRSLPEKGSIGKRDYRGGSIAKHPSSLAAGGSGQRPGVDVYKYEGIEAFGAKLMFDLQAEADKLKVAILKEGLPPPEPVDADSSRPWNLRTRRAACKAPMEGNGNVGGRKGTKNDEIRRSNSPVRVANLDNRERSKFSVSLSKREIDDDFLTMVSHRPPRRPKKRSKIVQNELDTFFPGLWLTEVTADMYKVPDSAQNQNENGKM